jgi:fructose-1,6-bisphosphatase/inositol monophosphatase family enzyme
VLSDDDLDACAELADELAHRATRRIVADRPAADQISTKSSPADWVTETDLAVERLVREALGDRFPGHRVVGEEYGTSGPDDAPATWWIDPVDGTTNFVHALPWSSFSLCVADERGPAVAVVADPYRREVLSAIRGRGAWLDGRPTSCSPAVSLTGGIVLTEMVMQSLWPGQAGVMQALAERGCVTRLLGSNALSLASVAAGRCVATVIGGFNTGDCLGGMLIARESGAHVFARSDPPTDGEPIVCAAPGVADELLPLLPGTP